MVNHTAVLVFGNNNDDHDTTSTATTSDDQDCDTTETSSADGSSSSSSSTTPILLTAALRATLKQSYSGFHTHHPEHAGWRFIEKSGRDMPEKGHNNSKVGQPPPPAFTFLPPSLFSPLHSCLVTCNSPLKAYIPPPSPPPHPSHLHIPASLPSPSPLPFSHLHIPASLPASLPSSPSPQHVLWMEGTSVAASPPFVPSIFHAAQGQYSMY